ncbi:MAG: hypothetical protein H8E44_37535 [Planctomycetes bacterium]|nr:hypothetical protein [Planctomycetota bacterium]
MDRSTNCQRNSTASSGATRGREPKACVRWTRFLTGVLAILLVAFVLIPGLQRLGPIREVREAIQRSGIDATALFYTESEVSGEAESSIRNAIRYSAHGGQAGKVQGVAGE